MTFQIGFVLFLLFALVVMFATEKLSVDLITLILLITLVASGILTPDQAFAGFSSDIIIILGSIFVISGALRETGVLDMVAARLMRVAGTNPTRITLALMATSASVSAFMSNTAVTAMLTPPTVGLAKRAGMAPSKLLMPLAFASILGGTCTLIGTSTNVAVSGFIKHSGMEPLHLFEFLPLGLVFVVVGITYMMLIGIRLLPAHEEADLTTRYAMRDYLSEIIVMPGSPLIGNLSYDSDLNVLGFRVLKIVRGDKELIPDSRVFIEEGDTLLVEGQAATLIKVKKIEGIEIKADVKLGDRDLEGTDMRIAEVLVTPTSDLAGRTLKEANFRQTSGLTVLALNRAGQSLIEKVSDTILRIGDVLLVQGPENRIESADRSPELAVLDEVAQPFYNPRKGLITVVMFLAAVILGTFGGIAIGYPTFSNGLGFHTWFHIHVPLSVAFLGAAVITVLLRCITAEKAYEMMDWKLLILVGGMTAFGRAMEVTGAAQYLADHLVLWFSPFGTTAILGGFIGVTVLLTQPMSNAAAALVVLPVAIQTAKQLGANPRSFAIAIMLAASTSFIAPFEPSNILVYGPGKYRLMDFVRVGLGLTILLAIVLLIAEPYFFPLY